MWRACANVQVYHVHVIGIGSDSVENAFNIRFVGLGGRRGPVLMSAPMVVYRQWWHAVGSGKNEILNGRAVESEPRWNNSSTATMFLLLLPWQQSFPRIVIFVVVGGGSGMRR